VAARGDDVGGRDGAIARAEVHRAGDDDGAVDRDPQPAGRRPRPPRGGEGALPAGEADDQPRRTARRDFEEELLDVPDLRAVAIAQRTAVEGGDDARNVHRQPHSLHGALILRGYRGPRRMFRRPGPPLLLALFAGIALAFTGVLAKLVPVTQIADQRALDGFIGLDRPRLAPLLDHIAHSADPAPYALFGLALALLALARGRWRVALAIPVLFVVTGATTEALKHVLASPRIDEWLGSAQIAAASWPSGHSTAAMTMALCATIAAPPRLRPTVAALGGAYAVAVAYSILTLRWHFPSDVFGGYLVAATYVLLAVSGIAWTEQRWPSRHGVEAASRPGDLVPALGVALLAAGGAIGLALARPHALIGYAAEHTTFVAGAAGIAALAVVIAGVLATGMRAPRTPAAGRS
jgi:membrane-associated phospholipid phosphatase